MGGVGQVAAAAAAFVGSHFALPHPLRRPIVERIGERGFLALYVLVAFATLGWLAEAFRSAPMGELWWPIGDGLWAVATVVMLAASVLLMGSLTRNPAMPTGGRPGPMPQEARGVFAVTRHPMMWSFALWSAAHLLVMPYLANAILVGAVAMLALGGAALQDRKKERLQPGWREWEARTSYWPLAAIRQGRARFGGFGGHAMGGGVVLWLLATWAHIPLAGWAAGVWRWVWPE